MSNALWAGRFLVQGAALAFLVGSAALPCPAADPKLQAQLQALVAKHLRQTPDYLPGDLLSRSQVEPIFSELIKLGLQSPQQTEGMYSRFLRDGEYLVQLLRSPQGRVFMRKVAAIPEAYDRLERLAWQPVGRTWLQELVAAENGDKLFAALTTEEGIKKVAESLSADASGKNFGLPTGRVHTEAELIAHLARLVNRNVAAGVKPKEADAKSQAKAKTGSK